MRGATPRGGVANRFAILPTFSCGEGNPPHTPPRRRPAPPSPHIEPGPRGNQPEGEAPRIARRNAGAASPGLAPELPRAAAFPLARISHTHGPKRTPRNRNLLSGVTVTREARTLTGVTGCGMGDTDLQPVAVKEQVSQVRHHPDGAAGRGFPCLRVAPPGGMGAMRQFSVRVAPSATQRALPRLRNPG